MVLPPVETKPRKSRQDKRKRVAGGGTNGHINGKSKNDHHSPIAVADAYRYVDVQKSIEEGERGKRNGVRGFSLSAAKLELLLAEWHRTGSFVSPYTRGVRTDHLMALANLGVNRAWSLDEIMPVLRRLMGEERWKKFVIYKRAKRFKNPNEEPERIWDNYRSFRRLCKDHLGRVGYEGKSPYGMRLWQIGCCIDLFVVEKSVDKKNHHGGGMTSDDHVERYVRLNTYSNDPLKMMVQSRKFIPAVDRRGKTLGPA